MTLKTFKDIELSTATRYRIKAQAIKQVKEGLKKQKNFFKVFVEFHNLTSEELR